MPGCRSLHEGRSLRSTHSSRGPHSLRGAGSLAVLLVLLLAASLTLLYANRALLFEQRAAANQVRAAMALAAAEAGQAWALAWLNHPGAIDAACQASSASGDSGFAVRYLAWDAATGILGPRTAARPACVADAADGWTCACPNAGAATLTAPSADGEFPAFAVEFASGPRAGTVRLSVEGCSAAAGACVVGTQATDAWVRTEVLLATLGAVPRPPYAALTALGAVQLAGEAVLVNSDAAGLVVASATSLTLDPAVQLIGPPGQDVASAQLAPDPTWADPATGAAASATSATARFFAHHFTLDKPTYKALPVVQRLACGAGCGSSEVAAAYQAGARLLWIDGALALGSPLSLGSAAEPVVLIVTGPLTLTGPIAVSGLVYAGSVDWQAGTGAAARLDGALLSEGAVQVSGRAQLRRDPAVLGRLRHATGVYAPLAGSWRDFSD